MHLKTLNAKTLLIDKLRLGQIGVNGVLPSERKLCELLGIGRGGVRAIIAELLASGDVLSTENGTIKLGAKFNYGKKLRRMLLVTSQNFANAAECVTIMNGISDNCQKHETELVFVSDDREHRIPESVARKIENAQYDGVIFLERYNEDSAARVLNAGIPVAIANSESPCQLLSAGADFRQIGRLAAQKLIEKGHKRIAFLGITSKAWLYSEELAGMREILTQHHLPLSPKQVFWLDAYGIMNLKKCLLSPQRPTAVFAGRDHLAQIVYQAAYDLRLKIPNDLSIIGYDNISWQDGKKSELSTIAQSAFEIGSKSVDLLRDEIENLPHPRHLMLPGTYVERGSIGTL